MQRAAYEKVVFQVSDNVVTFVATKWRVSRYGQEILPNAAIARERYEAMKMIAAVDYGFHLFLENFDEE